jgi:hypothetical protein
VKTEIVSGYGPSEVDVYEIVLWKLQISIIILLMDIENEKDGR